MTFGEMPREECGIFGVFNHPEAAQLTYLGLYALQHRGQESAGIVTSDGAQLYHRKGEGLVSDVFNRDVLKQLPGSMAIGHVRYSTTGSSTLVNAQPIIASFHGGTLAVSHNGNFTNAFTLKQELDRLGAIFQTSNDTEILIHLIARAPEEQFDAALVNSLKRIRGAYSMLILREDRLIAIKDPRGFRPLCLGSLDGAYIVASESCALDIVGANYLREFKPGEIITFSGGGIHTERPFDDVEPTLCVFEYIYYSRPDSMFFGKSISDFRVRLGEQLAEEQPAKADVVVPVPDSSNCAALGYARRSGIPFELGLIRSHYIGRTFIEPEQAIRDFGVKLKFNPVKSILNNKRVVLVDDSIVRGTTSWKIVQMLRQAGAREVHFRSSAPPWQHPCYFGIDTPREEELIASRCSVEEIAQRIGVDSLGYMSIRGLKRVVPMTMEYCYACFDGDYPGGKPELCQKDSLEQARGERREAGDQRAERK
jgi:amidophosphoribosyltransferase